MNRCLAVFLVLLLSFPSVSAHSSSRYVDDGWSSPDLPQQGYVNVTFSENAGGAILSPGAPYLAWNNQKDGDDSQTLLCSSMKDPRCSEKTGSFTYMTRLVACSQVTDLDCIESVKLLSSNQEIVGEAVDVFPKVIRTTYVEDSSIKLPRASSGQTWSFPGFTHIGGNLFFVNAILAGSKNSSEKYFSTESLSMSVYAVDFKATTRDDGSSSASESPRGSGSVLGANGMYGPYEDERYECVMSGDSLCANRRELPDEIGFSISLRLSASPSGWLHGRIAGAKISIENLSKSGAVRVLLAGKSVRIPNLGFSYSWSQIPERVQKQYRDGSFTDEGGALTKGCRWCSDDPLVNTTSSRPLSYGPDALQEFNSWINLRSDRADADINSWSVRTLSQAEMKDSLGCFRKKNRVNGFVSTNATIYSAGPPKLVKGTLDYTVAAPHFRSNGEETLGRYQLIMKSDVARCVYGFGAAPVTASVSVSNSNGVAKIATTSVTESDGWLSLTADNFTFSASTIKVKLSQAKGKKTITCIKGTRSKSVTGSSPRCPAGYKQQG
ncbi:MAG: hypothetical protein RLZZ14_610 [Actinomycetota bacterium]